MACLDCPKQNSDFNSKNLFTWCTNCGNYGINSAIKRSLTESNLEPKNVLLCFDIGCHGNGSDKIGGYRFHGLHGRVIPFASGASIANSRVKIIAFGGDGGTLGEGINHLISAVRNNFNFTFVLHNNLNYGLTQGQASPTTRKGMKMNSTLEGVYLNPINPTQFVLNLNPSFVARGYSGDVKHLTSILKEAINHKGFSYVEILQDCPTYNKETPHEWYLKRIFNLQDEKGYDNSNIEKALNVSKDLENKIALGVIYKKALPDFNQLQTNRELIKTELVDEVRDYTIEDLISRFK